ncbi:hypothetical protein NQ317_007684 [Molorchus minor]|uniref:Uncharacterized protein n=1 Tax=Molorchus minor TaxID=1323400 RepID=A0ABQ9JMQ4_9CUCU|nr:hypothetical protein NQ317_007684 [Molorchus minor]
MRKNSGDAVLLSRGQRSEKFDSEFVGPYTIKSLLSNGRYVLQKVGTRQTLKCSKDQLRIWPRDWTPDDLEYLLELNHVNSANPKVPDTRNLVDPGAEDRRELDEEEILKNIVKD